MINLDKLSDISIAKKLSILFLTVTLGFVITAATYGFVISNERESTKRTNLFVEYGQLVGEAQKNYFKVRRFEKDFLLSLSASTGQTYNNTPLDEHTKHVAILEKNMERLQELGASIDATTSDEIIIDGIDLPSHYISSLVSQASRVVEDYKTSFSDIVKFNQVIGFTDSQGLRLKSKSLLAYVEQGLKDAKNPRLFTLLAEMRSLEAHILQSIDLTEAYEELKNVHQKLTAEVSRSALIQQNKVIINNFIAEYADVMDQIVTSKRNANEYTELYDFMLGPMFDEMGQSSKARISQNQSAQEAATTIISTIIAIGLFVIAAFIFVALYYFANSLRAPIHKLLDTIHKVNQGNVKARVSLNRKDELGELATSFDNLLDEKVAQLSHSQKEHDVLNESVIGLIKAVAQLSKKDFTVKVPVNEDVTGAVSDSLNLLTKETSDALNDVKKIAVRVAGVSNLVQKQSELVMSVAENERKQVEQNVQDLNESSNEMNRISSDAIDANKRADFALDNTQSALMAVNRSVDGINTIRDTIRETEKRIKRLGERSQEITGVVNLINSIAERTHILALNASMHAASAGEAGRGFAVVADEVQRLAESAREATTEIDTLVNNIRAETTDTVTAMNNAISQVAEGTRLAEQAGTAMKQTQESTEDLVKAVVNITHSSKKQADGSLELVKRSKEIADSTRVTEKHLQQQKTNTNNLVEFSNRLLSTVRVFKLPKIDMKKKANVENVDVPELENVLNDGGDSSDTAALKQANV